MSPPILFPAKKYPNGEFYPFSNIGMNKDGYPTGEDPIEFPNFLKSKDYTVNSSIPTCAGVFSDIDNFDNVTLQTIDCSSKVFAFCEIVHGLDEYTSSRGLPTIPCVQENSRKKRESGSNEGIIWIWFPVVDFNATKEWLNKLS